MIFWTADFLLMSQVSSRLAIAQLSTGSNFNVPSSKIAGDG